MPENNRVQYNLTGLKNLTLTENSPFQVKNNPYVKAIQLNDTLTKMIVYLKGGIRYTDSALEIDFFVKQIIFNLITKTEVEVKCPDWYVEGIFKDDNFEIRERVGLQENITIIRSYNAASIYDAVVNSPMAISKNEALYERIFVILQNENLIMQFMNLYQLLLEQANLLAGVNSKKHYSQRRVSEYLDAHKEKYPFVNFLPSRDSRKKDKNGKISNEDTFTYIRNEIGHCEETNNLIAYKQAGKQITTDLIKKLLIVLNDVLMLL